MSAFANTKAWIDEPKAGLKYGFVVTKPLQLMVVLTLIQQLEANCRQDILIVHDFAGAKSVHERMKSLCGENCRVFCFSNEQLAYKFATAAGYAKLFIDSDVGFQKNLTILKMFFAAPSTRIAVYEEGLGSYRSDLYAGFKKTFLRAMGCGVFFGGNWRTDEIYLYQPEQCRTEISAEKIKIRTSISALLATEWDFLAAIFGASDYIQDISRHASASKECVIYLTSWTIDLDKVAMMVAPGRRVLVKPHPHIKEIVTKDWPSQFDVAPGTIPAEMIISSAARIFEHVSVLHHGSSVDRYLQLKNVDFQRVQ